MNQHQEPLYPYHLVERTVRELKLIPTILNCLIAVLIAICCGNLIALPNRLKIFGGVEVGILLVLIFIDFWINCKTMHYTDLLMWSVSPAW